MRIPHALGVYAPASPLLPSNPLNIAIPGGLGIYAPSNQMFPSNPLRKRRGVGVYAFSTQMLPANPLTRRTGMGCMGCAGLGQTSASGFDLSSITSSISSAWSSLNANTVAGMPMGYVIVGGAAALIVLTSVMGGKTRVMRKAAQYKAKEAYQAQLARIKDQYPGLTAKARRAIARSTS